MTVESGRRAVRGYVRVPSGGDSTATQIDALRAAGVEASAIVVEREMGPKPESPVLDALVAELARGDSLVVVSLERLATSLRQLVQIGNDLRQREIHLRVLVEDIDTRRPDGPALLSAFAVLAEFQRTCDSRGMRDGLSARVRGKRAGRPPRLDRDQAAEAQRLYDAGISMAQIALRLGVARTTVYGHVRQRPRTGD